MKEGTRGGAQREGRNEKRSKERRKKQEEEEQEEEYKEKEGLTGGSKEGRKTNSKYREYKVE
jgi:hypothetical protein